MGRAARVINFKDQVAHVEVLVLRGYSGRARGIAQNYEESPRD